MTLTPNEEAALAEIEWELLAPHTLEAIAARIGVSHQLVSQIEKRALRKLRKLFKKSGLGPFGEREPIQLQARVVTTRHGDTVVGIISDNGMTRKKLFQ